MSGLRLVVARLEVGSPLTMYPVALAEWTIRATPATYADEWGLAPRRNLRKRRYAPPGGKRLIPAFSKMAWRLAHGFPSPMSATSLLARRKVGMLRVALTSR